GGRGGWRGSLIVGGPDGPREHPRHGGDGPGVPGGGARRPKRDAGRGAPGGWERGGGVVDGGDAGRDAAASGGVLEPLSAAPRRRGLRGRSGHAGQAASR